MSDKSREEILKSNGQWAIDNLKNRYPTHSQVARLIGKVWEEVPLGHGGEKVVYGYPGDPNKAVAFLHGTQDKWYYDKPHDYSPSEVKSRFYLAKLINVLEPGLVPNALYAGSQPPLLVVEKIEGKKLDEEDDQEAIRETRGRFRDLGLDIDYNESNFRQQEDGTYTYLDTIDLTNFNPELIREALCKLPDARKQLGLRFLGRLEKYLGEMEQEGIKPAV
jgi:hypothetical protein